MNRLKRVITSIIRLSTGALFGALSVWPLAKAIKAQQPWLLFNPLYFISFFLVVYLLSFILAVALHEIGHVVAGNLAGMRFVFMMVWPVQIRRRGHKGIIIRPMFNAGVGLGGLAGMVPRSGQDMRKAYLWMLRGGPLTSLISGIIGILVGLLTGFSTTIAGAIFWQIGIINFLLFLLTIVPKQAAGYLSDGAAIGLLKKEGSAEVSIYTSLLQLSSEMASGKLPSEFHKESLKTLLEIDPSSPFYYRGQYFGVQTALERGDLSAAREHMENINQLFSKLPILVQNNYRVIDAMISALEGQTETAKKVIQQVRSSHQGLLDRGELLVVEALTASQSSHSEEAKEKARLALSEFERSMIPESHSLSRKILERILGQPSEGESRNRADSDVIGSSDGTI